MKLKLWYNERTGEQPLLMHDDWIFYADEFVKLDYLYSKAGLMTISDYQDRGSFKSKLNINDVKQIKQVGGLLVFLCSQAKSLAAFDLA